jgi:hypothetical protein
LSTVLLSAKQKQNVIKTFNGVCRPLNTEWQAILNVAELPDRVAALEAKHIKGIRPFDSLRWRLDVESSVNHREGRLATEADNGRQKNWD